MAGTATDWKTTKIAQNAGQLWVNLGVPGAGARLTLASDGTPDATANPNAKHLGATKAGAKLMIKSSLTKFAVDEFKGPIATNVDSVSMGISADLVGITDNILMTFLLPGVGTQVTASGYDQITVGSKAMTYSSIALIFPLVSDPTKYGIFHLYNAVNDAGVEWAQSRKELGFTPVSFVTYDLTSRAATDVTGSYWQQA